MMTDNPLTEVPGPERAAGAPGERIRRLQRRRRLVREELLAVAVLLVFLAATVAVLATQWLESGSSANAAGPPHSAQAHSAQAHAIQVHVPYGGTT
jgi:hypothetical protein